MNLGSADLDLADAIGLAGSALMVVAYLYSNVARSVDFVAFNALNLIGAIMLCWSLTVHFNLASFALEIVWMAIAAFGLARALARRRSA